jgi:peroxiredoxin
MRQLLTTTLTFLTLSNVFGQSLVKIGDQAPGYRFTKIINSPATNLDISDLKGKPSIIAFWGTWCAPCIPEMINLGKLQKQFGDRVQIIAVSDDSEQKIKFFLQKRPSNIWFASDPSQNLWSILGINTAGHIALIDKANKIVAITETNKIDKSMIEKLIESKQLGLEENRGDRILAEKEDPIKLDASTLYSFVMQPKLNGISAMMKRPNSGVFAFRRITMINLSPQTIFREAFNISIGKKVFFATPEDNNEDYKTPICIDFIVSEKDKTNISTLFQNELNSHLPFQGKIEKRTIDSYVLKQIQGKQISIKQSTNSDNKFSFNGLEFSGTGIPFQTFINYLENELNYPVYNATGLSQHYDIEFSRNNVEPLKSTMESLAKLGLELVKDQKEMDVLVISRK